MKNRLYVGPKQTTIENTDFFDGSITLVGDNTNNNKAFKNVLPFDYWNPDNNHLEIDIYNREIAKLTQLTEIMAHNPRLVSHCVFPDNVLQICKNSNSLLEIVDNKNQTRALLKNVIPMLNYQIIKGSEFNYQILRNVSDDLVVQHPIGSGGSKTFLCNQYNHEQVKSVLIPYEYYSISAYQFDNVPYNIHCVVGADQIVIFTPSKQEIAVSNILEYIGNDFDIHIPPEVKSKLAEYSTEVCKKLQIMGYRGVLGIDYIHVDSELYFIEINPRFQGSTRQVDGLLKKSRLPSIFDYNYRAFIGKEMPNSRKMEKGIE